MINQTFSIAFTKLFTSGNLEGLTYTDFISFPSIASRATWLTNVRKNIEANKLPWSFTEDILFYRDITRSEALKDYKLWAT